MTIVYTVSSTPSKSHYWSLSIAGGGGGGGGGGREGSEKCFYLALVVFRGRTANERGLLEYYRFSRGG